MRRSLVVLALLALSGCTVTVAETVPDAPPAPPPPPPVVQVWYGGQHGVPPALGGGWCYFDGPHAHDYYPSPSEAFVYADGFFYWRAPVVFTYVGGHPLPGGVLRI